MDINIDSQHGNERGPVGTSLNDPDFSKIQINVPNGWLELAQLFLDEVTMSTDVRSGLVGISRIYEDDGAMLVELKYPAGQIAYDIKTLYDIEKQFEKASFKTCQICGQQGRNFFGKTSWIIRCPEHHDPSSIDIKALFDDIKINDTLTKQSVRQKYPFIPAMEFKNGWLSLFERLLEALVEFGFDPTKDEIYQVKEKFAKLNVYVNIDSANFHRYKLLHFIVDEACSISSVTCEECGMRGSRWVQGGWHLTACHSHKPEGAVTLIEYYRSRENGD